MRLKLAFLPLFALLLSACALSPQQVTIKPTLERSNSNIGEGRTLSIEVVDARVLAAFGADAVALLVEGGVEQDRASQVLGPVDVLRFRDQLLRPVFAGRVGLLVVDYLLEVGPRHADGHPVSMR